MLNLPRVTGWGTDSIAETMIGKSVQGRKDETEKTKTIANAILQQAQKGNLNEDGFAVLDKFSPELGSVARKTNEQARSENTLKLQNMVFDKKVKGQQMFNTKLDAANKYRDLGDAGAEMFETAIAEAKAFADLAGIKFNATAYMDSATVKKEQEKFNLAMVSENVKGIQVGATPDTIAAVEGQLASFADKLPKGTVPMLEKMIATAKGRIAKEEERRLRLQDEKDKAPGNITGVGPGGKPVRTPDVAGAEVWKDPNERQPTGTLTEASVVTQFDNFSLDKGQPELKGKMYNEYLKLRRTNMSREDAFNKVMQDYSGEGQPPPAPGPKPNKDFSSLWK